MHGSVLTLPGWVPLALGVVERVGGMRVSVGPRLAANTIGEVVACASNCYIHNDVELSVERSGVWLTNPWVVVSLREVAALPETLLSKVDFEDLFIPVIDVSVETILIPVEAVCVEVVRKRLGVSVDFVSEREPVLVPAWAPMESRAEAVVASFATI